MTLQYTPAGKAIRTISPLSLTVRDSIDTLNDDTIQMVTHNAGDNLLGGLLLFTQNSTTEQWVVTDISRASIDTIRFVGRRLGNPRGEALKLKGTLLESTVRALRIVTGSASRQRILIQGRDPRAISEPGQVVTYIPYLAMARSIVEQVRKQATLADVLSTLRENLLWVDNSGEDTVIRDITDALGTTYVIAEYLDDSEFESDLALPVDSTDEVLSEYAMQGYVAKFKTPTGADSLFFSGGHSLKPQNIILDSTFENKFLAADAIFRKGLLDFQDSVSIDVTPYSLVPGTHGLKPGQQINLGGETKYQLETITDDYSDGTVRLTLRLLLTQGLVTACSEYMIGLLTDD